MLNCIADNCQYQAKYGKRYTTLKEYCYLHSSNMYVDLTLNTCTHVGIFRCENIAKYIVIEGSIAEFCYTHAPYNAFEPVSKCLFITCDKTATYGAPDTMVKEYCYMHCDDKLHVNLIRRPCAYTDCSKIARYRNTNGKKYCKSHTESPPEFIKCTKPKCRLTARYGLPNGEPLFCIKHYDSIHICVKGNICIDRSCNRLVPVGMNTCELGHAPVAICKRYKYDNSTDVMQYLA